MLFPLRSAPEEERVARLQLCCLLAAGVIDALFLILGTSCRGVMYFYSENWLVVPGVLFAGLILARRQEPQARRQMLLALMMVGWFLITQTIHRLQDGDAGTGNLFFYIYLLALPYAAAARDGKAMTGLRAIALLVIGVGLLMTAECALLVLGLLPEALKPYILWDGARYRPMFHPNICAAVLMSGMALCLSFFFRAKKAWQKALLLAAVAAQFACASLTNSRTSLILISGLLGAVAFFEIWGRASRRLLPAIVAALVLVPVLFFGAGELYQMNNARLVAQYTQAAAGETAQAEGTSAETAQTEEPQEETEPPQEFRINADGVLQGSSGQGSLANDMRTLNGRTRIWSSVIRSLEDTPSTLLFGTEYPELYASRYAFQVAHAHNSWLEVLLRMGLPGLAMALIFTWLAVRSAFTLLFRRRDLSRGCVALLELCLLGAGMLEPYLFIADINYHYLDFLFFLCLGYMLQWEKEDPTTPEPAGE